MTLKVPTLSPQFQEELTVLVESGLYESEEMFLADAVRALLAARPDLPEVIACRLYERGVFSLGRAAEWSALSIEAMKEALYRRGITRQAPEGPAETEAMDHEALKAAGRTVP